MVELKNEHIVLKISELGAEIKSLLYQNEEVIWPGNRTEFWKGSSPVLFPICGKMSDDAYEYNENIYAMPMHGFAKTSVFQIEKCTETGAVFLLKENEQTLKQYPFAFVFRVSYQIKENKVLIKYEVQNTIENEIYFSVGAHEGYYCKNGITDYQVLFPNDVMLENLLLEDGLLGNRKAKIPIEQHILDLSYDYFDDKNLIFTNIKSKYVILKNKKTNQAIKIDFPDFEYLLLWTELNAPFICIEPWSGITDRIDTDHKVCHKEGIHRLTKGECFIIEHSIELL